MLNYNHLRYKKIDRRNLKTHIDLSVGFLYSRPLVGKGEQKPGYRIVESPNYGVLYDGLQSKQIEVIWVHGPKLERELDIE